MPARPLRLYAGTLGASATTLYTVPANSTVVVKQRDFANPTAGALTYSVTLTPNGGAALVLVPTRTIAAGGTDTPAELANLVLNAGDVLSAQAGAAASIVGAVSGFVV